MNTELVGEGGSVGTQLRQLDESLALSRVGGDVELLKEVIELFLDDYPSTFEKIRNAVAVSDATALEHSAHSLKGSVSTFGANRAFEAAFTLEPSSNALNRIFTDRTLVGLAVLRVAERAMEAAGGAAFYRAAGLERLFRDIQGVQYHRPQERMQVRYSGESALGWEPGS